MQTVIDTAWLYPISDVTAALATTTYPHTFDGDNIVVPDMAAFLGGLCGYLCTHGGGTADW